MFPLQPGSDCPLTPTLGVFTSFPSEISLNVHNGIFHHHLNLLSYYKSLFRRMPVNQAAVPPMRDSSVLNHHPWIEPLPAWIMEESAALSEAEVLDEQMLRVGILASLQDAPDDPDTKVEVPKSSVSSLRLVLVLVI